MNDEIHEQSAQQSQSQSQQSKSQSQSQQSQSQSSQHHQRTFEEPDVNAGAQAEPAIMRLVYTALFYVVFALSRFAVLLIAVGQSLHVLMTGSQQADLQKFARNLNVYIRQLVQYVTWTSERKPFPFSDWPIDHDHERQ